jgi:hypothetical protein
MSETFMSRALLLVHNDGNFVFLKDTQLGDIQNDDLQLDHSRYYDNVEWWLAF